MTALSQGLGKLLFQLDLPQESLQSMRELLSDEQLQTALCSPVISSMQKKQVIDAIFEGECSRFVQILCQYDCVKQFDDILQSCHDAALGAKHWLRAEIVSARPLTDMQLEHIGASVCEQYGAAGVEWERKTDPTLLGGFVLTIGDMYYDQSVKGRIKALTERLVRR